MRVKKIACLILAGVMAAGMMVGCGKNVNSNSSTINAGKDIAYQIIAALDEETVKTIEFTAGDTELKADIETSMKQIGVQAIDAGDMIKQMFRLATVLERIDEKYSFAKWENFESKEEDDIKKNQEATIVIPLPLYGYSEDYVVTQLAARIDGLVKNSAILGVEFISGTDFYTDKETEEEYRYTFDYTGKLTVVEVTDVVTGQVVYVMGITVTRTPTKVAA